MCDRGLRHERLAREVAPGGILDEGGGDDAVDLGPGQHGAPGEARGGGTAPADRLVAPVVRADGRRACTGGGDDLRGDVEQIGVFELAHGARCRALGTPARDRGRGLREAFLVAFEPRPLPHEPLQLPPPRPASFFPRDCIRTPRPRV